MRYVVSLALTLLVSVTAEAAPLRVVATGDSQANGFAKPDGDNDGRLQQAFDTYNSGEFVVGVVAVAGTKAPQYAGIEPNNDGEVVDYTAATLALDPDVVVFMLGTNDAARRECLDDDGRCFRDFAAYVPTFLDRYRDAGVTLVVATPPPIVSDTAENTMAERNQVDMFLPFIRELAHSRGILLVDIYRTIHGHSDWESFYSGDGIHPSLGYTLIAEQIRNGVLRALGDTDLNHKTDLSDLNNVRNNFGLSKDNFGGDTDNDGDVDIDDLNNVRNNFGRVSTSVPGDTDGDRDVDIEDFNDVRNNFGSSGLLHPGDTNDDGLIDIIDLNNVRNNFGRSAPEILGDTDGDRDVDIEDLNDVRNGFGFPDVSLVGDTNDDGRVGIDDLNTIRNHFGIGGGLTTAVSVPEPSTAALTCFCLGIFLGRRSRRPLRCHGRKVIDQTQQHFASDVRGNRLAGLAAGF